MHFRSVMNVAGIGLAVVLGVSACGGGTRHVPAPAGARHLPVLNAHGRQLEQILAGLVPDAVGDQFQLDLVARQESLASSCMAARHLRYLPRPPRSLVDTITNTDFTSLAYAREYGFGVTTFPDLVGADPNAPAIRAMTPSARSGYEDQLDTCETAATGQANTEFQVDAANDVFDQIDAAVRVDPRYRAAVVGWQDCAGAQGYPQTDRTALVDSFQNQVGAIKNRLDAVAASSGAPGDDRVHALADHDPAFQQLRQREVSAAVSTFGCSLRLDAAYRAVYRAYEVASGDPNA